MMEAVPLRRAIPQLSLCDVNANTNTFRDESGRTVPNPIPLPSANTDPPGLAHLFGHALSHSAYLEALEAFDVLAFKSCYSASQIRSDERLAEFCQSYEGSIATYIDAHPDHRFVIVSPPPRRPLLTNRSAASRARDFSRFLAGFAQSRPNCVYCDLFDCLADSRDMLRLRFRKLSPRDQHPNQSGARRAGTALLNALEEAVRTKVTCDLGDSGSVEIVQ